MSKLTILAAGAAGYVLGSRAGRERYEQIADGARRVMSNPRIQSARQQAQDAVADQAAAARAVMADKARETAASAASAAADKVRRGDGGAHSADQPRTGGAWPADTAAPPAS
jgi:nucleoid-associated protein YgaU